jgi:hypothetical protein
MNFQQQNFYLNNYIQNNFVDQNLNLIIIKIILKIKGKI